MGICLQKRASCLEVNHRGQRWWGNNHTSYDESIHPCNTTPSGFACSGQSFLKITPTLWPKLGDDGKNVAGLGQGCTHWSVCVNVASLSTVQRCLSTDEHHLLTAGSSPCPQINAESFSWGYFWKPRLILTAEANPRAEANLTAVANSKSWSNFQQPTEANSSHCQNWMPQKHDRFKHHPTSLMGARLWTVYKSCTHSITYM